MRWSSESVPQATLAALLFLIAAECGFAQRGPLRLRIVPAPAAVPVGNNFQLKAQIGFFRGVDQPGGGRDVALAAAWNSSQTGIAHVNAGLVTANQQGVATIQASFRGLSDSTQFTVTAPVTSLSISPSTPSVPKGLVVPFTATANYNDSTSRDVTQLVAWNSSDPAKAVISSNGLAATRAQGSTTIAAGFFGANASTLLTIGPPELVSIAVTPKTRRLRAGAMQQFTALGTFTDQSVTDLTTSSQWSSANETVATIDAAGKLTAVSAGGPVEIAANSAAVDGTASVSVTTQTETVPRIGHIFLLVLENTNYEHVVGNAAMPFLNGLISEGALATNFFANTHPSIDNYFMLTTGQFVAGGNSFLCARDNTVAVDNLVRRVLALGRTWKSYAEDLPQNWMDVCSPMGLYVERHNPFTYFSDVRNSATQRSKIVNFSQFAVDRATATLPNLSYLLPNQIHNAHDCEVAGCTLDERLAVTDEWLADIVPLVLDDPLFKADGVLMITFDEAEPTDSANGGGRIFTIFIGPMVKRGYSSVAIYQHQSLLKTILRALGGTVFPGASSVAPEMGEFFE